jgi:hypothetical protein
MRRNNHLCGDIGEFTPLPGFHLPLHRLEAPLHPVDPNGDAVD